MVAQTFRGPHSLYRRYQGFLERTITAVMFALLITFTLGGLSVYPDKWLIVIGIAIAILGVRWPAIAYIVGVAVLVYPIYAINLYLAVLFIALAALGHRLFIHHLGATALVLSTPLLAQYHLHWLVPILAGLLWGGVVGAWVGGLAAIWGKLLGGMAGMNIDWLLMAGQVPDADMIATRFDDANSLNTLLLLVEPFANTSTIMLYHLLQVVGWTATGALVGGLASRKWVKFHAPWSIMVVTAGGGLIMLVTLVGLPYWLTEAKLNMNVYQDPVAPLFSLVVAIVVGTAVYSIRESLDLPVAPKRIVRTGKKGKGISNRFKAGNLFRRSGKPAQQNVETISAREGNIGDTGGARKPVRVPSQSELPEWEPPKTDSGLIMLEID